MLPNPLGLTVCVLQGLLLLGWFGDHFDQLAVESANLLPIAEEELQDQPEVFPLVRIRNIQSFGTAEFLC